jgi:hypothetical protein
LAVDVTAARRYRDDSVRQVVDAFGEVAAARGCRVLRQRLHG